MGQERREVRKGVGQELGCGSGRGVGQDCKRLTLLSKYGEHIHVHICLLSKDNQTKRINEFVFFLSGT